MESACELECETVLGFDLAFITEAIQEGILAVLIEIKRMLGGLIPTLVSAPEDHAAAHPSIVLRPGRESLLVPEIRATVADCRQLTAESYVVRV